MPVHINGRGPFRFFIDTGAERSAISTFLAGALGYRLAGLPDVLREGVIGALPTPEVRLQQLRCDAVGRDAMTALVLPEAILGDWDGLIGVDVLAGSVLSISSPQWQAQVSTSDSKPRRSTKGLRFDSGTLHLPMLRLSIGAHAVMALLDTGATQSVGNRALARALGLRTSAGAIVMDAAGARLPAELATVAGFRLDAAALPAAALRIAELPLFSRRGLGNRPALLLGVDRLNAVSDLRIDFRARRLYAR